MDLPEQEFLEISSKTPLINVDLLVINEFEEILLSWRDDEYCGTGWHIPGGIIRHGETMKERAEKTAKVELHFLPFIEDAPCKISEIFLNQQYRNHFISHLYKCRCKKADIVTADLDTSLSPGDLCWFDYYPGIIETQYPYIDYLKEYFKKMICC